MAACGAINLTKALAFIYLTAPLFFSAEAAAPTLPGLDSVIKRESNTQELAAPTCQIDALARADCGTGINLGNDPEKSCEGQKCCWSPTSQTSGTHNMPWCFYNKASPQPSVCDGPGPKVECGYAGMTADQCRSKGCCWKPNNDKQPWCFAPVINPPPTDVVVHLFEWRWDDIADECKNQLGPNGYKAVQVSPPQEDMQGNEWFTRYQPVSYKISSRSGDRAAFSKMVKTCRVAGVDVIVDVVLNHMANSDRPRTGRAGTPYGSRNFEKSFSNTCEDFHHEADCSRNCAMNNDADEGNVWYCDIGLPDLRTESAFVQSQLAGYLNDLASLGVAGVRVDAAKHIPPADLLNIFSRVNPVNGTGRPMYVNQEIIVGPYCSNCAVTAERYYGLGRVWEFKTPTFYNNIFKNQQVEQITQIGTLYNAKWADPYMAMSFVVNHDRYVHGADRPGTVTFEDGDQAKGIYRLAMVALLAHPYGQPNILSSYKLLGVPTKDYDYNDTPPLASDGLNAHQDCGSEGPGNYFHCEHRWPYVKAMVKFRQVAGPAGTFVATPYTQDPKGLSIRRDGAFMILSLGTNNFQVTEYTGLDAGLYCNILKGEKCSQSSAIRVGADGKAVFNIKGQDAIAITKANKPSNDVA